MKLNKLLPKVKESVQKTIIYSALVIGTALITIGLVGVDNVTVRFLDMPEEFRHAKLEHEGPGDTRQIPVSTVDFSYRKAINFNVPVTRSSVTRTLELLEEFRKGNPEETVVVLLDSPGGSVIDGNKLVNYMLATSLKVHTLCLSLCASMAAHIHQAGRSRLMAPGSTLMFHQAYGGVQGNIDQMLSTLLFYKKMVDRMDAYAADRAKIKYNDFKLLRANDLWIEAKDAYLENLTDKVVIAAIDSSSTYQIETTELLRLKAKMIKDLQNKKYPQFNWEHN